MVRLLVTGGAGFIGGHLVSRLASNIAAEIVVLDNFHRAYSWDSLPSGVDCRHADIRDPVALADAVRGCEIVFHLAAQSNVVGAVADAG